MGSYTAEAGGAGAGIAAFRREGPRLEKISEYASPSPSHLLADRGRGVLYAVNELPDGAVSSYRPDRDGVPQLLSSQQTGGAHPCHAALTGGFLLAANYGSGSVSAHPLRPDGTIGERTDLVKHEGGGPRPDRQEGPHAHQVLVESEERVTVVDLGLDQLLHYRLENGRLTQVGASSVPPGSGPRHAVSHPSGRWYVAAELDSTLLTMDREPVTGRLTCSGSQPATRSASSDSNYPSAIVLSADGRHLYLTNRGANTIATFLVGGGGQPELVDEVEAGGYWPRDLAISGDLLYVANERSHTVVTFRRDAEGLPRPTGEVIEVGSPTCVLPW